MAALALLVALLLGSCSATDAIHAVRLGTPTDVGADPSGAVVLPTEACGDYFIAETYVDGAGPFAMLLDTGAGTTVISRHVADEAGVRSRIERIDIGELHVEGRIRCAVRELDHLSDALGMRIDGILGHPVFRKVLLTYDYPEQQIRVRIGELTDDLPGLAPMSTSRRPMIGAMVGDTKVNVLLDTGSSHGLSLSGFDELDFATPPSPVGGRMRIDGLHLMHAGRLRDNVRFGSFRLAQPIVRDAVSHSLLGHAILRDYVVTVDQQRGRVQIVRSDGAAASEPLASATLYGTGWVLWPEDDRLVVRRVFEGSAAEAAGLQPGDVLLEVGGESFGELGCSRRSARADVPTRTTYTIERDGEQFEVEVTTGVIVE